MKADKKVWDLEYWQVYDVEELDKEEVWLWLYNSPAAVSEALPPVS